MNPLIYILALCVTVVTPITPELVQQIRTFGNQAQETVFGFLSAEDEFILQDDNPPLDDPFEEMNNFLLASQGNLQVKEEDLALVNLDPKVTTIPPSLEKVEEVPTIIGQEMVSEPAVGIEPRVAPLIDVENVPPPMPEVGEKEVLSEEKEISPMEEEEEDEDDILAQPVEPPTLVEIMSPPIEPTKVVQEAEVVPEEVTTIIPDVEEPSTFSVSLDPRESLDVEPVEPSPVQGEESRSDEIEMMAEDLESVPQPNGEFDIDEQPIDRQDNLAAEDEKPRQVRIQRGRRIPARDVANLPLSPGVAPNVINPPQPPSDTDTEPSVTMEEEVEAEEDENLGFVSSFFRKFLP